MVDNRTRADVQRSFGRCTLSPGFLDDFYRAFTQSSNEIRDKFRNTDFQHQKELLKSGLSFMIMYAGGRQTAATKLDKIGRSHGKAHMDIPYWMYDNWKVALLNTIKRHDKKINWELLEEWDDVLQSGIDRINGRPALV